MTTVKTRSELMRCVDADGYEISLTRGREYRRRADPAAELRGFVRVIDDTGEDYLFAAHRFVPIGAAERTG